MSRLCPHWTTAKYTEITPQKEEVPSVKKITLAATKARLSKFYGTTPGRSTTQSGHRQIGGGGLGQGHSLPSPQQFLRATQDAEHQRRFLVFCLGSIFLSLPVWRWAGWSSRSPLLIFTVESTEPSLTRTWRDMWVWQPQWQANRRPTSVPPLLPPQKHSSSENGRQEKIIPVGNSDFSLYRESAENVSVLYIKGISLTPSEYWSFQKSGS